MGKVQKILVPSTKEDREEYEAHQRSYSNISRTSIARRKKSAASAGDISHYEEMIHPNEEKELDESTRYSVLFAQGQAVGWVHSRFVRWFIQFDEEKLRPFFIKNYSLALIILEEEYQTLLKENFEDD
jgi:hypothetical protein